jgi:hypothetical protein
MGRAIPPCMISLLRKNLLSATISLSTVTALGTVAISCSGCFISESSLEEPPAVNFSYELYLTRTALTGTEYEQYKLLPMGMYMECGLLRRGRAVPSQQGIIPLPQSSRSDMGQLIGAISERILSNPPEHLAAPGNNSDMFDAGKFFLTGFADGKPLSIKTSFDAVANGTGELEQAMGRLAETARGVPENPPCKNQEFFGLQRRGAREAE